MLNGMSESHTPSGMSTPPSSRRRSPTSPDGSSPPRAPLSVRTVSSLEIASVHRSHTKPVISLDFNSSGTALASSSGDSVVTIYDALESKLSAAIPVKKYGAGVVRFIHSDIPPCVVSASTLIDNDVRLLDLDRETYIRYFRGHDDIVTSISASPTGPEFISSSQDAWVRVWDVRKQMAIGKVRAKSAPVVAYDPKGLIFSLAYNSHPSTTMVKLYDARQFDEGPFLEFQLDNPSGAEPTCLKFSSDGEYFLLVNGDVDATVSLYDAYKGKFFRKFKGHRNASAVPLEASFSPDSAFIASGSDDGSLFVWDLQSQETLVHRKAVHAMPLACTIWNPVYQMLASSCQNVLFWLPQAHESQADF